MQHEPYHPIPPSDPITGSPLYVSELKSEQGDVTIRGRFALPSTAKLDAEQHKFLETFLRCRGIISTVEREMGISYPTVRARLDSLLAALNLTPAKEEHQRRDREAEEAKKAILDQLERGEITAEEAKQRMRGAQPR